MTVQDFPIINASLNGNCAAMLLVGYTFIRRGQIRAHATMMISAFITSIVFLACYVTYHTIRVRQGITVTRFPAHAIRPFYRVLLLSHTILAIVIVPLILTTLWRAAHRQWDRHRSIAIITFPLWLYVSVTGVIIYWMLYDLAPRLAPGH